MSTLAILGGPSTVSRDDYGTWPDIQQSDRDAVLDVLDSGILTGGGATAAPGLATDYAAYVGVKHCLAFNSGTAALHAALVTCGLGPGDEAIVPAFTYVASAMCLVHAGVRPVFCDVEPGTYLLDPSKVEALLTPRTKAILAVHLHGMPADMDALRAIADRHSLAVIEDASQAHGAVYRDRVVGSIGDCAGASLNATKNLPGGEGGLFVTDDDELVAAAERLRYMGEDHYDTDPPGGRRYWAHGLGWNYRAQELPSALARSQLKRLDGYNAVARRNADLLNEALGSMDGILPPETPADRQSVWYIYRPRLDLSSLGVGERVTEARDRVMAALRAEGVMVTMWQHHPLPAFPAFRSASLGPWHPSRADEELSPWDASEFPVAQGICDATFVIGSGATPLAAQSESLVSGLIDAIGKVFEHVDEVLDMPFDLPEDSVQADLFTTSKGSEGAVRKTAR